MFLEAYYCLLWPRRQREEGQRPQAPSREVPVMWSEEVQMCLRRLQSQGLPGTGMKEQRPSSWSVNEAGADRAWAGGLLHAGGPARFYGEGARKGAWGPEAKQIALGFALAGGGPGIFLVGAALASQSSVQMYIREDGRVHGLTKQRDPA